MSDVSAYDVCDLHETTFLYGDVCPVCESEMWDYVRDVTHFNMWLDAELIWEMQAVIHEGDVYFLMIEQHSEGEYIYSIIQVADGCREPGVPW